MVFSTRPESLKYGQFSKSELEAVLDAGVSRVFGNGDIANEGMLSGWAVPEDTHNWNDGVEATFRLAVKASGGAFELLVEGAPLIDKKYPKQEITLYVNGFRVGYWNLDDRKPQILTSFLEPEQIFWRGELGYAKCVWHMPNAVRLSEVQDSTDSRQLAFCFHSITMRAVS
jgi:hypothetical protein